MDVIDRLRRPASKASASSRRCPGRNSVRRQLAPGTWTSPTSFAIARTSRPGFERMTVVSIAVHVVAFAGFMFAPAGWLASQSDADPTTIMTISLGSGGEGPQSGGLTTMGGRAVQAPAPEQARPEPVRPPAAVAPEMTLPTPGARRAAFVARRQAGARRGARAHGDAGSGTARRHRDRRNRSPRSGLWLVERRRPRRRRKPRRRRFLLPRLHPDDGPAHHEELEPGPERRRAWRR